MQMFNGLQLTATPRKVLLALHTYTRQIIYGSKTDFSRKIKTNNIINPDSNKKIVWKYFSKSILLMKNKVL